VKQLILGGARSGKSAFAEQLATETCLPVTYIATATAQDAEMASRIQHHHERRPEQWVTLESPLHLATAIESQIAAGRCLLVDCLTMWLTNWLMEDDALGWVAEKTRFLDVLSALPSEIILVSNETGSGVVPLGELSRRFVDEAGWLHQAVARHSDRVIHMIAGLPQLLKGEPL